MDVKFINPVLQSMVSILKQMAQLEARPGKVQIKQDQNSLGEVTGMMRMDGKNIQGSIALSFSSAVIFELVKRMLRTEISDIDETAKDLTGELSNIVVGTSKTKLVEKGYDIDMSLPKIVVGEKAIINHDIQAPTVVLPFKCDAGVFYVEMCFKD